jgi:transposase
MQSTSKCFPFVYFTRVTNTKMPRGSRHLTVEQRQEVRTLYFQGGNSYTQIQRITGYTKDQIGHAIRAISAKILPRSGRPRTITREQEEELIAFVCASKRNRRMCYLELSLNLFEQTIGEQAIRNALYRHGFRRRVARYKPPISEANRIKRLAWAHEHLNWTREQWDQILWTDETWVTGGTHQPQFVTRRQGEENDPTCIQEKIRKKKGWMFWGCFSGVSGKGPGLFWEKEWGSINQYSYQEHTLPLIDAWIHENRRRGIELLFMQDGAPGHAAQSTQANIRTRGIQIIFWPPFSPDLNPIENCWNWIKDYIEDKWGLNEDPGHMRLREYVLEAWDMMPDSYWRELLDSMPARCQAVIDANGMHTKYY